MHLSGNGRPVVEHLNPELETSPKLITKKRPKEDAVHTEPRVLVKAATAVKNTMT